MATSDGMRLGLIFAGGPSVPEMVAISQRAEARGFESIWVAETRLTRDGFVPLAAIGAATSRITIGTGIVPVFTRPPVVLAISFRALEEIAPGRVKMGIGTGSPKILETQGIAFERPLTRLREYCNVLPRLVAGESVTFHGETMTLTDARIEDVLASEEQAAAPPLPLWLGVTGPKALQLSGQMADGVLLNVCLGPDYVRRAMSLMREGAAAAGRDPERIEVGMGIVCSPDLDGDVGRERARRFVALYLSLFPNVARETGIDSDLIAAVRDAFGRAGLEAAVAVMGSDPVQRLAAAGTPAEVRDRLDEYVEAGVDMPVLVPVEGALEAVLALAG